MSKREFETGATRDGDKDKFDYEGFLSPLVLRAYAEYLHKHRVMKDGTTRASDNWQQEFGKEHYDVCMKSLLRHVIDLWLFHDGYKGRDTIQDALSAIIFNASAYLYKLEKDKEVTHVEMDLTAP